MLKESNFPIASMKNTIQNIKIINFFTFADDEDLLKFFIGNKSNNLIIPNEIAFNFIYKDEDQKEIKTSLSHLNSMCLFSMELSEACFLANSDEFTSDFNKNINYLCEKMEKYIESRKTSVEMVGIGSDEGE